MILKWLMLFRRPMQAAEGKGASEELHIAGYFEDGRHRINFIKGEEPAIIREKRAIIPRRARRQ
jgi:hypothetical protein